MSRRARVTRVFIDSAADPMSEVLSDFRGEIVTVTLKTGRIVSGVLTTSDADNYEVRDPHGLVLAEFHRDEALALRVDEEVAK